MKVIDISVPISERLPAWPGDAPTRLWSVERIDDGALSNGTRIELGLHAGTHYDAPLHFLEKGKSIDSIPLHTFSGPVYVAHMKGVKSITADYLSALHIPKHTSRILFKTANSEWWNESDALFRSQYVGLSQSAAEWIVERKIVLVGIDYLSVAAFDEVQSVHETLLKAEVTILEGLDLRHVEEGEYRLIAYPLLIPGAEAAPTRAVLIHI